MRAGRRNVRITHPDKGLFPDGTTKADLANYYRDVAGVMLPHVRDRPVSMQRFNGGIGHQGLVMRVVKSAGSSVTCSLPRGSGHAVLGAPGLAAAPTVSSVTTPVAARRFSRMHPLYGSAMRRR